MKPFLILLIIVQACTSSADKFARKIDIKMIEADRNDLITEIMNNPHIDFSEDTPSWEVLLNDNCATIVINGSFKESGVHFYYSIKEHYLIDIPAKGYYHFCRDTISLYDSTRNVLMCFSPFEENN